MATLVKLRELTADERTELERLARSRTEEARLVVRAKIVLGLAAGERPYQVADRVGVGRVAAYEWLHRFNAEGLKGLTDHPRPGRPPTYTADQRAEVDRRRPDQARGPRAAVRVVDPGPAAGVPERAQGDRHQADPDRRDPDRRGAAVAQAGDVVRAEGGPGVRRKKGAIEKLYTSPPEGSVVVCLDEMGPEAAKSFPGQR